MPYIGNKYEIGDHNNSWKTLDDISSYVATFDGSATNAVSTSNNTIRVPEHRFIQGQRVTYSNGGGGNIGGLTSGTAYYIIHDTNNEFKLATSLVNANNSTAINISAVGSGSSHTVTAAFDGVNKKFKITYSGGKSSRFTSATQLSVAINNILQRPNDTTTFTDGFRISDNEKIEFNVAPVAADIFWGSILSASLPTFDISDNKLDNFTGDGSTTDFTLSHIPVNNEGIIVTINGVIQHPTDKNGTRAYSLDASILVFTAAPANGDEIQVRHIGFAGASSSAVTGFYGRTGNVTLSSSADNAIVGVITATAFSGPIVAGAGTSDIVAGIITVTKAHVGGGTTWGEDLVVTGNARVTGILTVGTNSVTITGNDVNITGVTTASNFKTGTTNVHNVGVEAAGINVLGADTPIGLGATIYNSGAAVFTGVVTATTFKGNIVGTAATFTGPVTIGGTLTYEDVTNIDSVGVITARNGIDCNGDLDVAGNLSIADKIIHTGDTNTAIRFPSNDIFQVETNGSARLKITNGDLTMLDYTAADKVGIGTNVLVAKLDVKNNSNIPVIKLNDSHFNKYLTIRGGGSPNRMVIDAYEGSGGGADIDFASNGDTKVRIESGGRVGINTTSPENADSVQIFGTTTPMLTIKAGASGSDANRRATLMLWTGGNKTYKLQADASDGGLKILDSSTERLNIDSSGHMGLGVTPNANWPTNGDFKALQIGTGIAVFGRGSGDEDRGGISANLYTTGSAWKYLGNGHAGRIYFEDGSIVFNNAGSAANSSGANAAATLVETLRIDSSGRLLVGTTVAPASTNTLLRVHTPISSSSVNSIEISHNTNGADKAGAALGLAIGNGGASTNAADLYFSTATNGSLEQRLRITSAGDMGLGCSNPGADPAIGNDATVFEIRQTTSGSLTSGNNRRGAVLRLKHEAQWENGYQSSSPNDDLGRVEFVTGDASVGEGKRAIIRCRNLTYFNNHALTFEVADANSTSVPEIMRLQGGRVMIAGATDNTNAHANADDLIIGNTGSDQRTGITIVSDTDKDGAIHFSDGAGAGQLRGQIVYGHTWGSYNDVFAIYTAGTKSIHIQDDGDVILGEIGTTTYTEASTEAQLRVVGDAANSRPGAISLMGFGNTTNAAHARINFQQQTSGTNGQTTARIEAKSVGGSEDASDLVFYTEKAGQNLAECARMTTRGELLINRTDTVATGLNFDSLHLGIGGNYGPVNSYRTIGFGYRTNTTSEYPASIGCQITDWAGHTKAELVFATRNTTGQADVATERLRIKADGRLKLVTDNVGEDKINIRGSGAQMIYLGSNTGGSAGIYMDGDSDGDMSGGDYARIMHSGSTSHLEYANWKTGGGHKFQIGGNDAFDINQYRTAVARGAFATGSQGTTTAYTPTKAGYIGDERAWGLDAVYYMGWKNSSSTSNYSHNMLDIYRSGHWGQYTKVLIWTIYYYPSNGFRMWKVEDGNIVQIHDHYGNGSISNSTTQVGSGTHGGQNVHRYSITCTNGGTYHQNLWFVGLIGGGTAGHCGTNLSVSSADSHYSANGGGIHFNTISGTDMYASPHYANWR